MPHMLKWRSVLKARVGYAAFGPCQLVDLRAFSAQPSHEQDEVSAFVYCVQQVQYAAKFSARMPSLCSSYKRRTLPQSDRWAQEL